MLAPEIRLKAAPVVRCVSKRQGERGLESTDRMTGCDKYP
jgi:hypothetical protein